MRAPRSADAVDAASAPESTANRENILVAAILVATAILLLGNSAIITEQLATPGAGLFGGATTVAMIAFLLNIALLFTGWLRYREMSRKFSEYVVAERRAQDLAVTDPLTGLANRRAIKEIADALIGKADARKKSVAFLLLDLDNFKQVNDIHGHSAGDQLLTRFAARARRVAPARAFLSRIGGDEFAFAFIFDPATPQEVDRFAEALIEETQRPFSWNGILLETTVSIGIARHDLHGANVETLIRRADIAMYEAKRYGKNAACWFDSEMETRIHERAELEAAIRKGIEKGEFVPYFEQQVELSTGRLLGFEMLARWDNDSFAHVSTEKFIDVAQEAGLISDLSVGMLDRAFREARDWSPSLTLSVNISPSQLLDERLAQHILKLLVQTGFPAQRLEVEITEGAIFQNVELARTIIFNLKNQGIRIAYDDFGTGYSSLSHLRELPFDRIKIDRSFVSAVTRDEDSAAMVRAITSLCTSLGLPITAEGIADELVRDFMVELGDFVGQGYYFGRPLSLRAVRKLLAERDLLPPRRAQTPRAVSASEVATVDVAAQGDVSRAV